MEGIFGVEGELFPSWRGFGRTIGKAAFGQFIKGQDGGNGFEGSDAVAVGDDVDVANVGPGVVDLVEEANFVEFDIV